MLRLLLFGLVIILPTLGGVAGYQSYRDSSDAKVAAASAAAASASENTPGMLDKYLLVAARINDLLGAYSTAHIRARERPFHEAMDRLIGEVHEIVAASVIDATGRELVSAGVYPVNRDLDQSGRDDYKALRDTDVRLFVGKQPAPSLPGTNFDPYVTLTVRRTSPDRYFNGVVVVTIASSHFASFYKSLVGSPDYTTDLLKEDGTVLAQFPAPEPAGQPLRPDPLVAKALAAGGEIRIADRGTPFDNSGRIVAIGRVADYPLFVAVERSKASMATEWLRSIAGAAAIGVAALAALIGLTRIALRRARRETLARAQAAEAFADRAALEVRLHRMQRSQGVALLATGMAAELDRLLVNSQYNLERLEAAINGVGAGQQNFMALKQTCTQASVLVKRLLGFSRREPIKPGPININEVIDQAFDHASQFTDAIAREARLQKDLWLGCVDPDQLATSVLNLMFNARDIFPAADKLIVATTNVRIDKSDVAKLDGGKAGEYVGLFIEGSRQGSASETDKSAVAAPVAARDPGRGGGWPSLSLMRELVQSSGGYWTVSREPMHQTTIRIYFPRYLADLYKTEHRPIGDRSDAVRSAGNGESAGLGLDARRGG